MTIIAYLLGVSIPVQSTPESVVIVTPKEQVWTSDSKSFQPSTQTRTVATLFGNVDQDGPFVISVKLGPNTTEPPVQLTHDVSLYCVKGTLFLAITDLQGKKQEITLPEGTFCHIPAGVTQSIRTGNSPFQCIVWGQGPRTYTTPPK